MSENCHSSHVTRFALSRKPWRRAGAALCVVGLTLPVGCSSSRRPPAPASVEGGTSGDDERNASGGPEGGRGGGGLAEGAVGDGGQARGGAVPGGYGSETSGEGGANAASDGGADSGADGFCGDTEVQDDEDCDPAASSALSCADFGFDGGVLACSGVCEIDTSACTGVEQCQDGRDNDGDGTVDCQDFEDCGTLCNAGCAAPLELSDPGEIWGSTSASPDVIDSGCGADGTEQIFRVIATSSGQLAARLKTTGQLSVSIRQSCSDAATELSCGGSLAIADVQQGQAVFVIVEGPAAASQGAYSLTVESYEPGVCGDDSWDPGESCEDNNLDPGDGCDAQCQVEATESEVNDRPDVADVLAPVNYGEVQANDVDVFELSVTAPHTSLLATIYSLGERGCSERTIDPYLELLDENGTVLAKDDDGGDGTCPELAVLGIQPGMYFLRVRRSPNPDGERVAFSYELEQRTNICGDGEVGLPEQCDDANIVDGDGCDGDCRSE